MADAGKYIIGVCFLFIFAIFVKPLRIPLRCLPIARLRNSHFVIDFWLTPLISIAVLLAAQVMSPRDVWNGIKGDEHIVPWTVMIIFFGLAYICVSWDISGIFTFLALKTLAIAGSSGKKIFLYVSAHSSALLRLPSR
jgi:Na+/H+ antiporter NhaD/arsenite permease-like protein